MTAILTTPTKGRGAFPTAGTGGTLYDDGTKPGRYYRAPAPGTTVVAPGVKGEAADRLGTSLSLNEHAVWRAAIALQIRLNTALKAGLSQDGIIGPLTGAAIEAWQGQQAGAAAGVADGVYGPRSAKAMWGVDVRKAAAKIDPSHVDLLDRTARGTIGWESGWDPGAVGVTTPVDLGIGQLNGPSHPDLSVNDRLDPLIAIPYVVQVIDANLTAFAYQQGDAIAAYNLGQGGCRSWIKAGRPDVWVRLVTVNGTPTTTTTYVRKYIDAILAGA